MKEEKLTTKQIQYRVNTICELQNEIKKLQDRVDRYKKDLKDDMIKRGDDTIKVGDKYVDNVYICQMRLDTNRLKKELPDVYHMYTNVTDFYRINITPEYKYNREKLKDVKFETIGK